MNKKVNNENEGNKKKSTKWKKRAHLQHPSVQNFFLFLESGEKKTNTPRGQKRGETETDLLTRTTEVKVSGFTKICGSTNTQNYVKQKV